MTRTEAKTVLDILLKVDGGCPGCVNEAMLKFVFNFPQWKELAKTMFFKEFEQNLGNGKI